MTPVREARLLYVAMTRATEEATVMHDKESEFSVRLTSAIERQRLGNQDAAREISLYRLRTRQQKRWVATYGAIEARVSRVRTRTRQIVGTKTVMALASLLRYQATSSPRKHNKVRG